MLNRLVKDAKPTVQYAVPMESMGDRIKNLRIARGLTQPELAEICGVTKSAVSQWEDGSTTDIKLVPFLKLVDALKTDGHYLVYGADRAPRGGPDEPPQDSGATGRFRRPGGPGRR